MHLILATTNAMRQAERVHSNIAHHSQEHSILAVWLLPFFIGNRFGFGLVKINFYTEQVAIHMKDFKITGSSLNLFNL